MAASVDVEGGRFTKAEEDELKPTLKERTAVKWATSLQSLCDEIMRRVNKAVDEWDGVSHHEDCAMIIVKCNDLFDKDIVMFDSAVEHLCKTNSDFNDVLEENDLGDLQLKV